MNDQQLIETKGARQVPIKRRDGLPHATPIEIREALYTVLIEDAENPNTPRIPSHIGALIREAIARANRGEFQ